MLINYNKGWTYEYTDEDGNRFYRMWDRQNKQLHVLNLRHYKDHDMNHVNWEIWRSPSFCENESHAEDNLEYFDGAPSFESLHTWFLRVGVKVMTWFL